MATILVAEDRAVLRAELQTVLERYGYSVELARNGEEVLDKYRWVQPDLVLLDMFMPVMNGFDALYLLRQEHAEARVLAVSGGGSRLGNDALAEARALGAQVTLQKPFRHQQLLAAIHELLLTA